MNHVRRFLPVIPMFLRAMPPSIWTADNFYTWLQEFNPSILAEAKLTPDAFFAAWVAALGMKVKEPPEGINPTIIKETRMREWQVNPFSLLVALALHGFLLKLCHSLFFFCYPVLQKKKNYFSTGLIESVPDRDPD